ncbi:hypothetical protein CPB86DRAFT_811469 [Serendipita vermifera]|nr:hypothetical protein CPB86DRAFT_811469 [Serendipita vermifera]
MSLSFPIEQYQHLPNPYPHDAIRDSFLRTNIVNLDLASPPPQRSNPRSHPLTPPDTPSTRKPRPDHELPLSTLIVRKPSLDAFLAAGFVVEEDNRPTRYLVVGRVPPETPINALTRTFGQMGDLKGIFVRYQNKGIIALSWHDIRDAKKARNLLLTNNFFGMEEPLSAAFITPKNLIKATGESPFVDKKEGTVYIVAEQRNESAGHQPVSLHAALALFGDLVSFHAKKGTGSTVYIASYYDAREAANAAKALHGRSILGMFVQVVDDPSQEMKQWVSSPPSPTSDIQHPNSDSQTPVPSTVAPATHPSSQETLYSTSKSTPSSINGNISEEQKPGNTGTEPRDFEPLSPVSTTSFSRGSDKRPKFPRSHSSSDTGTTITPPPVRQRKLAMNSLSAVRPKNIIVPSTSDQGPRTFPPRMSAPWNNTPATRGTFRHTNPRYTAFHSRGGANSSRTFSHRPNPFAAPFYPSNQTSSPRSFRGDLSSPSYSAGASTIDSGPSTPRRSLGYSPALSKRSSFDLSALDFIGGNPRRGPLSSSKMIGNTSTPIDDNAHVDKQPYPMFNTPPKENVPSYSQEVYSTNGIPADRNSVDICRIEAGVDTRTTVMLKNIPNKMSDVDLRKYISDVVPKSFDFVYLRFDYNSSANVGYAFINFIEVKDLLTFAKARLGVKWNMFCSEKVLQMSYANFQGKEALVEKFKNSCVMEMQDEWVPKIFYSSGPHRGEREPFPVATNPSRARRSQDQRERGLLRTAYTFNPQGRHPHYRPPQ